MDWGTAGEFYIVITDSVNDAVTCNHEWMKDILRQERPTNNGSPALLERNMDVLERETNIPCSRLQVHQMMADKTLHRCLHSSKSNINWLENCLIQTDRSRWKRKPMDRCNKRNRRFNGVFLAEEIGVAVSRRHPATETCHLITVTDESLESTSYEALNWGLYFCLLIIQFLNLLMLSPSNFRGRALADVSWISKRTFMFILSGKARNF